MKSKKKTSSKNLSKKDELRIKKAGTTEGKKTRKKTSKKARKKTSKKREPKIKKTRTRKTDETVKMTVQRPTHGEKKGYLLVNIGKILLLVAVLAASWYFFDRWLMR